MFTKGLHDWIRHHFRFARQAVVLRFVLNNDHGIRFGATVISYVAQHWLSRCRYRVLECFSGRYWGLRSLRDPIGSWCQLPSGHVPGARFDRSVPSTPVKFRMTLKRYHSYAGGFCSPILLDDMPHRRDTASRAGSCLGWKAPPARYRPA